MYIGRAWETVNTLKIHYMNMFDNYLSPRLHEKPLSKLVLQMRGGRVSLLTQASGHQDI